MRSGRRPLTSLVTSALAALALGVAACGEPDGSSGRDGNRVHPVTLALDFLPNAIHAGVYTAVAEGEDAARGIALEVRSPSASTDSLRLLTGGRADVAIVDIHDLGLARQAGEDIVGVGAVVQAPLAAVLAAGDVQRPRELEGRRVGVTGLPSDEAVLRAVVEGDGGDVEAVDTVTIGFSAVRDLAAGNVDAATAFWNAEGVALRERGVDVSEFRVADYGAPAYPELVLAVRRETLEAEPGLIEAVRGALAAGTESALADRAAAVAEIAEASAADPGLVRAQLDAVAPTLVPAVRLDGRALAGWADFAVRFGILEQLPDVDAAFALDLPPPR